MTRSETLGTRTTPTTKKLIRLAATESGVSVSEWAADALRRAALRELGKTAQTTETEAGVDHAD